MKYLGCCVFITLGTLLIPRTLDAQHLGLMNRGDVGVLSGTQPDEGYYFLLPLYYRSDYDGLRDRNGNEALSGLEVVMKFLSFPAVAANTGARIAGATYGFQIVPAFMNQRLEIAAADGTAEGEYGFADIFVEPINLGWRRQRSDFLVGYGFFAPTGSGRRSLNMWAHQITAGTTVYLDRDKKWHAAATGYYEIHHKRQGLDLRVGDIFTLQGGTAYSFLRGDAYVGAAYFAQWKVTDDSGSDFPAGIEKSKNRAFGIGPDVAIPVFDKESFVGLVNVRYIWEFGAKTNFEGKTVVVGFTLGKLMGSRP